MDGLETGLCCLLISLLWGATNPLIKKSTKDITKIQTSNYITKFFYEIKYLLVNWRYIFLFLINQAGSIFYLFLLQRVDLSFIVPTVNAVTFVITGLTGVLIGEKTPNLRTLFGLFLVISGITFCVVDKINRKISVK